MHPRDRMSIDSLTRVADHERAAQRRSAMMAIVIAVVFLVVLIGVIAVVAGRII